MNSLSTFTPLINEPFIFTLCISTRSTCAPISSIDIILFYETGMRLSELIGLDVDDVNFIKKEIKITGKVGQPSRQKDGYSYQCKRANAGN